MGAEQSPGPWLAGIGHPTAWVASTTGITESDPSPGRDVTTSLSRTRIALQGSPELTIGSQLVAYLDAQVCRSGSVVGGQWAWRRDGAGSWYGQDRPVIVDRSQVVYDAPLVGTLDATYAVATLTTAEHRKVVAFYEELASGTVSLRVGSKGSTVWVSPTYQNASAVVSFSGAAGTLSGGAGCSIVQMPDGAFLLYGIYTEDEGATWTIAAWRCEESTLTTWTLQHVDCFGFTYTSAPPRVLRAAVSESGVVVLFATRYTSTSTRCTQYESVNGLNFTQLSSADTYTGVVWDLRNVRGTLRAVFELSNGGTPEIGTVPVSQGAVVFGDMTTAATFASLTDAWIAGGCIVEDHYSDDWLVLECSDNLTLWRSSGNTVSGTSTSYALTPADGSGAIGQAQAVWHRGALLVTGSRRTASTLSNCVMEVRLGSQSDLTVTRWWDAVPQWIGLCEMDLSAQWQITDIGAGVTRSHDYLTGEYVTTDGVSQGRYQSGDLGACKRTLLSAQLRVEAGTALVRLQHTINGTDAYAVHVEITSTTIVMYDATGSAGSTTTIAQGSSFVSIIVWLQGSTARCWYRIGETEWPLQWQELTLSGITTAAGTTSIARIGAKASSGVRIYRAGTGEAVGAPSAYPTIGAVNSVQGIPLVASVRRYFADSMTATVSGLPAYVDGVSHRVTLTSANPREHADPYVSSSPRRVWRMPSGDEQVIHLTPASGTADRQVGTGLWCLYLGGLHNVHGVEITGGNAAAIGVDLRRPLAYSTDGWTVRPLGSGSTIAGQWVGHDELVGAQFELHDGTVRRIASNTSGSLTSGAVAEHRAVITLDGSAGTAGAGHIWPRDAAVLYLSEVDHGGDGEWTITIAADGTLPSGETYREIGVLHLCPVAVAGISPDRTGARETTIGQELQDGPDGTRYVTSPRPNQRRIEWSYVASPHDVTGQIGVTATDTGATVGVIGAPSPDWIALQGTDSIPSGAMEPTEVLASIVAATGRRPTVLIGCIPTTGWPDGGAVVVAPVPWRQGVHYGHITGEPRTERVPTSDEGYMLRLSPLALEEAV